MPSSPSAFPTVTLDDVRYVSPTLASLTETCIVGDLWSRPELSPRDRSIITVSALIAGGKTLGFAHYFNKALDSGVTPAEMSEIITHVAFYAGWSASFSAVIVVKNIFEERGIGADQIPAVEQELPPIEAAQAQATNWAPLLHDDVRSVVPALVEMTEELLYRGIWLRKGLDPRSRHLATIAALIGLGKTALLAPYLESALSTGVTKTELLETITSLAFYVGWPSALLAASAAEDILKRRIDRPPALADGRSPPEVARGA